MQILKINLFIYNHLQLQGVKLRKSAERALAQIEEKNYHARYASQSKKVILVGVSFDRSSIDIAATTLQQ